MLCSVSVNDKLRHSDCLRCCDTYSVPRRSCGYRLRGYWPIDSTLLLLNNSIKHRERYIQSCTLQLFVFFTNVFVMYKWSMCSTLALWYKISLDVVADRSKHLMKEIMFQYYFASYRLAPCSRLRLYSLISGLVWYTQLLLTKFCHWLCDDDGNDVTPSCDTKPHWGVAGYYRFLYVTSCQINWINPQNLVVFECHKTGHFLCCLYN